ncbi:MAG: hypothetical protein IT370_30455 [Deltaproteobacteria bacterium]|nr:hypothetical protein [Deltaproteobacteria bacterium]
MVIALLGVFGVLAALTGGALHSAHRLRRGRVLDALVESCPAQTLHDDEHAVVRVDGILVEVRLLHQSAAYTTIECALPDGHTLVVALQPGRPGGGAPRLLTGDDHFDQAYHLEGAPADVVRRMFGDDVRRALLCTPGATLEVAPSGGHRVLRMTLPWVPSEDGTLPALARLVVVLAGRVREASAAADQAQPALLRGAPYRPMLDDAPMRQARSARRAEVTALAARLADRAATRTALSALLQAGALTGGVAATLAGALSFLGLTG